MWAFQSISPSGSIAPNLTVITVGSLLRVASIHSGCSIVPRIWIKAPGSFLGSAGRTADIIHLRVFFLCSGVRTDSSSSTSSTMMRSGRSSVPIETSDLSTSSPGNHPNPIQRLSLWSRARDLDVVYREQGHQTPRSARDYWLIALSHCSAVQPHVVQSLQSGP